MFANDIVALKKVKEERSSKTRTKGSGKALYYVIGGFIALLVIFKVVVAPILKESGVMPSPDTTPSVKVESPTKIVQPVKIKEEPQISDEELKEKIRKELEKPTVEKKEIAPAVVTKPETVEPVLSEIVENSTPVTPELTDEEKRAEYISTRKKILLGVFINSEAGMSILGDSPKLLIKGTPYSSESPISGGFKLGAISFVPGSMDSISDIRMKATIIDIQSGVVLRKITLRVGDYYTPVFYEGALEIISKTDSRGTGIVLPQEELTSAFSLESVEDREDVSVYTVNLGSGKLVKEVVSAKRIF